MSDTSDRSDGDLTIFGSTGTTRFARFIAGASDLTDDGDRGSAAEGATRRAAAAWGLPDFIYEPVLRRKGSSNREISDGIIIHGPSGVVIQVKHRSAPKDNPTRETNWITSNTKTAISQVNGTVRTIAAGEVTLRNLRGTTVAVPDGIDWLGLVIIDHPRPPPRTVPDTAAAKVPTVVMLRRDWEFLFDQLRSTYAVLGYLRRAANEDAVELGDEPVRYYDLAGEDDEAAQAPPDPSPVPWAKPFRDPMLPIRPVAFDDEEGLFVIRQIMEDIATGDGDPTSDQRLDVVHDLDRLLVTRRAELGRLLLNNLAHVQQAPPGSIATLFRRFTADASEPNLLFGVCNTFSPAVMEMFTRYVLLRHSDRCDELGTQEIDTVGILLTPRSDGRRPWDSNIRSVRRGAEINRDQIEIYRQHWDGQLMQKLPFPPPRT